MINIQEMMALLKKFSNYFGLKYKKTLFFVSHFFDKGELCTSQRKAIIKLIEKKDKDKRLIQNWRPISLLNVDSKIISKALSKRTSFCHLFQVINPLILMEDSLVKADV